MKKRRIKKKSIIILILLILFIIGGILGTIKIIDTINYHKTYEYKLLQVGYNKDEVKILEKNLSTTVLDYLLTIEYNDIIAKISEEKYFMEKNLNRYLDYYDKNKKELNDVVAIVNVGADNDFYTNTKKSDISLGNLMITNKFYYLDSSYNSDNMVKVSSTYSYGTNQKLTSDTFNAFLEMWKAAKKDDLSLIINSSYRSYEEQEEIYNEYKALKGEEYADSIAAKPGFSEHQTGMAIDIQTYGSTGKTFEEFDEFKWLQENAYKYGFILRYPKDKEYLTGYSYESWHYRYVGYDVAKYIHDNDITFDEYYAYFIEKD